MRLFHNHEINIFILSSYTENCSYWFDTNIFILL